MIRENEGKVEISFCDLCATSTVSSPLLLIDIFFSIILVALGIYACEEGTSVFMADHGEMKVNNSVNISILKEYAPIQ